MPFVVSQEGVADHLVDQLREVAVVVQATTLDLENGGADEKVGASESAKQRNLSHCLPVRPQGRLKADVVAGPQIAEPVPLELRVATAVGERLRAPAKEACHG